MARVIDSLGAPGAELRETHISWVLLEDARVLKIKKPVDFGFLDFSTLDKRRLACEAELRLNRRLAPDVYLRVAPVTLDGGTPRLDGSGELIEHAVIMRRLPDADRADQRLARGALDDAHLRHAAEQLARFHHDAARGPAIAARARADAVAVSVRENFEQTRAHLPRLLGVDEARELERAQLAVLETEAARFAARAEAGRAVDGHGDLRLEHLYFDARGELRILDCVEFSERLRHADVACDVAFLAMDLGVHGRVDLAERFLGLYAEAADDHDLYALVDFYESYRAFVRGKILCFALDDPALAGPTRTRLEAEARRFFRLALASERRALLEPTLIAVGGVVGTGKSSVADALGRLGGAPVIGSDRVRKARFGRAPTERLDAEAYRPEVTEAVYAELARRAALVLESGRSAIVDASFSTRAHREALRRVAAARSLPFRFVECRAPAEVLRARLARRAARGDAVSDAGPELLERFTEGFEPLHELDPHEHRVVDTHAESPEASAERLRGFVPMWPPTTRRADG